MPEPDRFPADSGVLSVWPVAALARALRPLGEDARVVVHAQEDSTNATLLQWGRDGERRPCLLVAEHQRAGRGRAGRAWQSAPGDSLTFSLGLPYQPADWSGLSLAVGLALAEALDPPGTSGVTPGRAAERPRLMLKWPNDLWLVERPGAQGRREGAEAVGEAATGRKLGGILIETCGQPGARWCVVGVGLNIRPHRFEGLDTGYACLQELDAQAQTSETLLRVAGPLSAALARFAREGFPPLQQAYASRDLLRGHEVGTGGSTPVNGLALGVDASGALRVRGADGAEHAVVAGEVSVRPLPGKGSGFGTGSGSERAPGAWTGTSESPGKRSCVCC